MVSDLNLHLLFFRSSVYPFVGRSTWKTLRDMRERRSGSASSVSSESNENDNGRDQDMPFTTMASENATAIVTTMADPTNTPNANTATQGTTPSGTPDINP